MRRTMHYGIQLVATGEWWAGGSRFGHVIRARWFETIEEARNAMRREGGGQRWEVKPL